MHFLARLANSLWGGRQIFAQCPRPHDARKGRHYYTRRGHRFARPEPTCERKRARAVYSSDAPCGRHGGGAAAFSAKKRRPPSPVLSLVYTQPLAVYFLCIETQIIFLYTARGRQHGTLFISA